MNIYGIFMLFFGLSTVIGVPLLSSFQVTQIKGSDYADWLSGLGATLGPAFLIVIIVSIIAYKVMEPLIKAIKKSETRELTRDERAQASKVLKNLRLLQFLHL